MKLSLIVFLLLHLSYISAQEFTKVFGKIKDERTGEGIEFVNVYIPETKYYTETNNIGDFQIQVPSQKSLLLKISRLGYETKSITLKDLKGKKEQTVDISLKALLVEEVVITGNSNNADNLVHEQIKEFQLLPTASGNIESILPSIALGLRSSAGGELSSQYSVRGGSYDENLMYINDFEIFRPQLIRNGQQEGLSFPNPNLIRDLSFSSGGFEAKYGDKQSSVLDIKYKVPEAKKYSLEASFLGASAHLEGSLKLNKHKSNQLRYLFGLRYKSNQYLLNSQDIEGEYVPRFVDAQSYLSYDLSKNLQVTWLGNINTSKFSLIPQSSAQARGSLLFGILSLNSYYEGRELDYFNTAMTGLSFLYFPKESKNKFFIKLQSSVQGGNEAEQFDISGYYRLVELEINNKDEEGKEVKLWGEGIQHRYGRNYLQSTIQQYELRTGMEFGSSQTALSHLVQAGVAIRKENFRDQINEWERIDSAGYSVPYRNGDSIVFNEVIKSKNILSNEKFILWFQDAIALNKIENWNINLVPGIRFNYNNLNNEFIVNPRLKLEAIPKNSESNLRTWLAIGLYHQPPLYRELRTPAGVINPDVEAQKSFHIIAGTKKDFNWKKLSASKFRWISEIYYKRSWDQISYDLENVRIRYSGQNDSKAYAIGWDNRINAEFVPGAESWVNFSILRTRENLDGIQHLIDRKSDGSGTSVADVPRPTDQLLALSMFFQDYLPNNENFKTHVQATIASGFPYGVEGDNLVYRNEYRFKPYHRVDIGFSYKLWDESRQKSSSNRFLKLTRNAWISAEVFNLLQVKNAASVRWIKSIYNYEFAIPYYLSSRRINLRLRLEF
ncbi:MAG: TonB-dependent receptor [Saprospiraceae bacterium]